VRARPFLRFAALRALFGGWSPISRTFNSRVERGSRSGEAFDGPGRLERLKEADPRAGARESTQRHALRHKPSAIPSGCVRDTIRSVSPSSGRRSDMSDSLNVLLVHGNATLIEARTAPGA